MALDISNEVIYVTISTPVAHIYIHINIVTTSSRDPAYFRRQMLQFLMKNMGTPKKEQGQRFLFHISNALLAAFYSP
jgi:hypothetical protein